MNQQVKFQSSFLAGLICALSACVTLPAAALPEQGAGEVLQWSYSHPLIAGLKPSIKLQTVEPDFDSTSKCQGNELSFAVWAPDKQLVIRELIDYRSSNTSFDFDPKNSAGINLIRQVYDSAIAQDFASSTPIAQRNINTDRSRYYRGKRYGYLTRQFRDRGREDKAQHRTASQVEVVPLSRLNDEIQRDQKTGQF
ncbi:MAG: phycobilisome linker polypeptide [Myxacorys chilensis ATA2-1-KO14]|jgi:hypothetical protein|nr:phycobilisome linker polypeptide [Myxacorys chilensis ATA2-1-KO14]